MNPAPLLLCLCLSFAPPPRDRWLAEDKWKHFFASFVVTSLSGSAARAAGLDPHTSAWVGVGIGTSVGVWKEIRDHGRSGETASLKDLTWDLAGVGAAAAALRQAR
jgi:putative lipoprotein